MTSALTSQPAQRFGLRDRGSLEKNERADLVIVDPEKERKIERGDHKSKCGWSPYEGLKLKGWPERVFINGEEVTQAV